MARSTRATRGRAKSTVVKVDFTGVETSGKVQAGPGVAVVESCEIRDSDNGQYLNWKLKVGDGYVYHTTSLLPQALWNLRATLEALGVEVESSAMDLDTESVVGLEMGVEVDFEVYQGKKKPVLVDMYPLDDPESEGRVSDSQPDDEEEEASPEYTYEDLEGMELKELLEVGSELGLKVPVKIKRDAEKVLDFLASELGVKPAPKTSSRKKSSTRGATKLRKGVKVTFEDDGETIEATVVSVNEGEGFAVLDVDGDEWEVETSDLTVV